MLELPKWITCIRKYEILVKAKIYKERKSMTSDQNF